MTNKLCLVFLLCLAACTPAVRDEVEVFEDLPYHTVLDPDVRKNLIDVYRPASEGPFPVVVVMHGGAQNNKGVYASFSQALAKEGFVVFTPDLGSTRGSSGASLAENNGIGIREMHEKHYCAALYASEHAADHGGNGENIIFFGVSAGGYAGLWTALVQDEVEGIWDAYAASENGPQQQVGCLAEGNLEVAAFIGFNSAISYFDVGWSQAEQYPELFTLLSPSSYFGQNSGLHIHLIQGTHDSIMPDVARQKELEWLDQLAALGHPTDFSEVESEHEIAVENIDLLIPIIQDIALEVSSQ